MQLESMLSFQVAVQFRLLAEFFSASVAFQIKAAIRVGCLGVLLRKRSATPIAAKHWSVAMTLQMRIEAAFLCE